MTGTATSTAVEVLVLLALFQIKHLVADFFLQNWYMLRNRRFYGHPGGLLHVAIHIVLSAAVLAWAGVPFATGAALLAAEASIHYHLDWAKDNLVAARGLTPQDALYWYAIGIDQGLHHLTYIAMVWWWMG